MIVRRIDAFKIIILVKIHLWVHVGTWLFSSWSVSQPYIHYYLPTIQFLLGRLVTSNLNFLIQIYPAALFQVSFPVHTSWRLCKQLPEEALPVPCRDQPSPACPAVAQPRAARCRWAGSKQCLTCVCCTALSTLLDQHCQLHTAVSTLQTQLIWHASSAQDSDQRAWVLRREKTAQNSDS